MEEIAGLMLFSSQQMLPSISVYVGTYGEKSFEESGAKSYDLTDQQISYLKSGIRDFLVAMVDSPETSVRWNNRIQAMAESEGFGIPVNNGSDPRHGFDSGAEFNIGTAATNRVSRWPEALGLAATFDPEITRKFGDIAAKEYRALGLTTNFDSKRQTMGCRTSFSSGETLQDNHGWC